MRRILLILLASLALKSFFMVAFLWREAPVHAAGAGSPVGNGDVNGDGTIDVSDDVYLISRLFLGGPEPVAIDCPATPGKGVPATGQTKCYNTVGDSCVEVPCDEVTCQGQDGQYAAGCPSEGRFVDNGDGTVTDTCTGLMWQKDTADVDGDGDGDPLARCDALAYCEKLSFAGYGDWRLPNVRELESIVDYGRANPAIDPVFGAVSDPNDNVGFTRNYWYWSSSTRAAPPFDHWLITFYFGLAGTVGIVGGKDTDRFFVRAVRSGPWREAPVHAGGGGSPAGNGDVNGDGTIDVSDAVYLISGLFLGGPEPVAIECPATPGKGVPATGRTKCSRQEGNIWIEVPCDQADCQGQDGQYAAGCPSESRFVDNGDGTVNDTCTGLMWQKETADVNGDGRGWVGDRLVWCDALAYCENLDFAGHHDWRLPNVRELLSIIDYGRRDPAIDPVFGAVEDWYWSSSTYVRSIINNDAWLVYFRYGYAGPVGGANGEFGKGLHYYVRAVRSGPSVIR